MYGAYWHSTPLYCPRASIMLYSGWLMAASIWLLCSGHRLSTPPGKKWFNRLDQRLLLANHIFIQLPPVC